LSWGCFYAMSDNVYGPYDYKGSVIEKESFAPGYDAPTWPKGFKQGRHGSFFEWHNQWYFTYCDISQTGNRFFRDSFISYLHYKANGEMAIVRVDGTGVGEYDANNGRIEAEDYFSASGNGKIEINDDGFVVGDMKRNNFLIYPNIKGLNGKKQVEFRLANTEPVSIEIRKGSPENELIGRYYLKVNSPQQGFRNFSCDLTEMSDQQGICLIFGGKGLNSFKLDSFLFK
jgi:arabinoxylan arabinofuranohydrolase